VWLERERRRRGSHHSLPVFLTYALKESKTAPSLRGKKSSMKILIADDDKVTRRMLEANLTS
jgi:hypothetical protein